MLEGKVVCVSGVVPALGATLARRCAQGFTGTLADSAGAAATAANSNLKRLPTEDEVASAIIFLGSDLASGITGQTLDVNCGEYKA
jgi:NAD(P)-dependent dehydrogenase (short-subunit alcohol dehydrogenase family)